MAIIDSNHESENEADMINNKTSDYWSAPLSLLHLWERWRSGTLLTWIILYWSFIHSMLSRNWSWYDWKGISVFDGYVFHPQDSRQNS
jgi:hypothetical protein